MNSLSITWMTFNSSRAANLYLGLVGSSQLESTVGSGVDSHARASFLQPRRRMNTGLERPSVCGNLL